MFRSFFLRLGAFASLGVSVSCKLQEASCDLHPWTDSVGRAAETDRLEIQWLRIAGKLDSAQADPRVRDRVERSVHSLDSSARRYRDSLRARGNTIESMSGCIDWNATIRGEQVDHQALITAWVRTFADSNAVAVEWAWADTAKEPSGLHVFYQVPGANGGSLDSANLRIEARRVLH